MNINSKNILSLILLFFPLIFLNAQDCLEKFQGRLADKEITICFYEYEVNGMVKGFYFYQDNKHNNIFFEGTIKKNDKEILEHIWTEYNNQKQITGYFQGVLNNEILVGSWTSPNGEIIYKYRLVRKNK